MDMTSNPTGHRRVRRAFAAVVCGALLAAGGVVATDDRADALRGNAEPQAIVNQLYPSLDAMRKSTFQALRFGGYRSPAVPWYWVGGDYLACGTTLTSGQRNTGFYCERNNTIYLDYTGATTSARTSGDYSVGVLLAHERGHAA